MLLAVVISGVYPTVDAREERPPSIECSTGVVTIDGCAASLPPLLTPRSRCRLSGKCAVYPGVKISKENMSTSQYREVSFSSSHGAALRLVSLLGTAV